MSPLVVPRKGCQSYKVNKGVRVYAYCFEAARGRTQFVPAEEYRFAALHLVQAVVVVFVAVVIAIVAIASAFTFTAF